MTKKAFILFALPILLTACGNTESKKSVNSNGQAIDSAYYHKEKDAMSCTVRASLPAERLNQSVGEWLDEALGGQYTGDPTDIQGIVDFYGMAMTDSLEKMLSNKDEVAEDAEMAYEARMEHCYETGELVTYTLSTFIDLGGAHPLSTAEGATFRKKDGRRVGWDIIARHSQYLFLEKLKEQLKAYFEVETDEELAETTMLDVEHIPLPKTPPYFTEDGIRAVYQEYEIAAYAYGMPEIQFTYDELKPLLTGWAQRLIKQEQP